MPQQAPVTFLRSLQVAARGIGEAVAEERNLRTHLVVTGVVVALAAWLRVSRIEWGLLLLCVGLVLAVELLNTAVETVVDLVSPEHHDLARKAKDIAAGAVLTATILSVLLGLVVLLPPLVDRLRPPRNQPLPTQSSWKEISPQPMKSPPLRPRKMLESKSLHSDQESSIPGNAPPENL